MSYKNKNMEVFYLVTLSSSFFVFLYLGVYSILFETSNTFKWGIMVFLMLIWIYAEVIP